ncbi:hypothetical protein [Mucilaginibacter sp. NFX135]|uniref:hypothetical protein n=1 Tax=Mucilaginibacter sp. NFX135 TaxID=3402687 RepID=UPI003AFB5D34
MLLLNLPTRLSKIILLLIFLIFIQSRAFAAYTFNWDGSSSTAWTTTANWTVTGSGTGTADYPGSGGRTDDIVLFGVSTTIGVYTNQPTLTLNANQTLTIASITFGSKQYSTAIPGTTVTINGSTGTLAIAGDITQNPNLNNSAGTTINNFINGTATLKCVNIRVGLSGTTGGQNSFLFSHIANLNVSGSVLIIPSTSLTNGSGFRLEDGIMRLDGQISITNPNGYNTGNNLAYFTVNGTYNTSSPKSSPTLYLNNANAIGALAAPYGSINLYGNRQSGTLGGRVTIYYTAPNAVVYTSSTQGFGPNGGKVSTTASTDVTYDNLVVQGSNAVIGGPVIGNTTPVQTSYLNIDSTFTTSANVTFATVNTTTTIGISGSTAATWTNSATVTGGVGATTINGSLINNSPGIINQAGGSLSIASNVSNTGALNLGSGATDINGSVNTSGSLTMSSGTLNIAQNYTNSGTFTAGAGLITFDGTAAQTLIDQTTAGTKFNNVTFTNGTTGATSKRMKLNSNFFINPTYTINVNGSGILTVENTPSTYTSALTLLSNASGDASIGNLTAGAIAGKIEVQRFIKGGARRYMLLSSPVADTTNTVISSTSNSYSLKPIILPGAAGSKLSTIVTGPSGSGGGFDSAPATGNSPSVFVYNENAPATADQNQVAGNEYKALTNTSVSIPIGNGILLYYRGSRDQLNPATGAPFVKPFPAADDGTLTFFGSVIKGTTATNSPMTPNIINLPATTATDASTYPLANTAYPATLSFSSTTPTQKRGYNLVGNPYASVIDLAKVGAVNTTLKFYYLLIKNAPTGTNSSSTRFVLINTSTLNSPVVGTGGSQYVLSGQGFFVIAPAASTKITFDESMKVPYATYTSTSPPIFNVKKGGPSVVKTLAVNGGQDSKQATASVAIAATTNVSTTPWLRLDMMQDTSTFSSTDIYFDKNAQNKFVPGEDAPYLASSGQGNFFFSQTADSIGCFANYTTELEKQKRINLFIAYTNYGTYKLTAPIKQNIDERYTIFLKDKFTNDSLDVIHNTEYTFNVTTAPASYARDRFYLSIGIAPGHEYKLRDFNGAKQTSGIKLTWQTDNESNSTTFVVEKSTNGGNSFIAIDSLRSTGVGSYSYTDIAPGSGQVLYRLKQQLVTGRTNISNVLNFNYLTTSPLRFIVYPSTASQSININFGKTYSNAIKVNIATASGGLVKTITASNTNYLQQNISNLLSGLYVIEAVDESTGKRIGSAKFYKQ